MLAFGCVGGDRPSLKMSSLTIEYQMKKGNLTPDKTIRCSAPLIDR